MPTLRFLLERSRGLSRVLEGVRALWRVKPEETEGAGGLFPELMR